MRHVFELTPKQLNRILDASKPTPAMWGSDGIPFLGTPQENANRAWKLLANELGFVWDSVQPVPGKPQQWVSAEFIEPTP